MHLDKWQKTHMLQYTTVFPVQCSGAQLYKSSSWRIETLSFIINWMSAHKHTRRCFTVCWPACIICCSRVEILPAARKVHWLRVRFMCALRLSREKVQPRQKKAFAHSNLIESRPQHCDHLTDRCIRHSTFYPALTAFFANWQMHNSHIRLITGL